MTRAADHTKILAFIDGCEDKTKLKTLLENARKQGVKEVEDAAFRKLVSIAPEGVSEPLERDFWRTIHAFELVLKEERGKTVLLSRTRQKVARAGVSATLEDWAHGKQTQGFDMLIERGMPELTGEAIVLRHPDQFSAEAVESARRRLADIGYSG